MKLENEIINICKRCELIIYNSNIYKVFSTYVLSFAMNKVLNNSTYKIKYFKYE